MTEQKEAQLIKWIKSKSMVELRSIVDTLVQHLMETDEVRINDEGEVYWEADGDEIF